MPEPLPLEARTRLLEWGVLHGHSRDLIRQAVQGVRAWHLAEGSTIASRHRSLRGWEQQVRNAIAKGWWSDYAPLPNEPRPAAPGATDSAQWQKDRDELRRQVDSESGERAERFGGEPS